MGRNDYRDLIRVFLVSAFALALAFGTPLLAAYKMVRYGTYYGCLSATVVLVVLIVSYWVRRHGIKKTLPKGYWPGLSAILLIYAILIAAVPDAFRVMDDEGVLLNTALSLYEEQELFAASKGYWIDGEFEILEGILDKRPFLYSFLLSLVHHLLGYRPENAFLLNGSLGGMALLLCYRLLGHWFGMLPAAIASLSLASTPLFLTAANGAGFEMLNLFLLLALAVTVCEFMVDPNERAAVLLSGVAVALAYARYESVLFVLPVGILLLVERIRRPGFRFHWAMYVVPFLLVPYVWLFRCTLARKGAWARAEAEERTVFGFEYLWENLVDTLRFFFTTHDRSANDPVFIYLGVLGLIAFVLYFGLRRSAEQTVQARKILPNVVFWTAGFGLLWAVLLSYFWSSFMDPMAQRMSFPFFLGFAFGLAVLLSLVGRKFKGRTYVLLLFLLSTALMVRAMWSVGSVDATWKTNALARLQTEKMEWFRSNDLDSSRVLFIDNNGSVWTALRAPTITWGRAGDRIDQMAYHHELGTFEAIYCVQVFNRSSEGSIWRPADKHVNDALQLRDEWAFDLRINSRSRVVIRRVEDIAVQQKGIPRSGSSGGSARVLRLP